MEANKLTEQPTMIEKLRQLYPSGLVLGNAMAIVGQFGLTIQWHNLDGSIGQRKYKDGEKICITEIKGDFLHLGDGIPSSTIHHSHFKGFEYVLEPPLK